MSSRTLAAACFAVAGAGSACWALLAARPSLSNWFLPADLPPRLLLTFVAADVVFFVVLPVVVGVGSLRGRSWTGSLLCVLAGGVGYAALWGWGLLAVTGEGWEGAALMTPPALLFGWHAWASRSGARNPS